MQVLVAFAQSEGEILGHDDLIERCWEGRIVGVPGTGKADHLRGNMGAVQVRLSPVDFREPEAGLAKLEIYGGRMDARQMTQIGWD